MYCCNCFFPVCVYVGSGPNQAGRSLCFFCIPACIWFSLCLGNMGMYGPSKALGGHLRTTLAGWPTFLSVFSPFFQTWTCLHFPLYTPLKKVVLFVPSFCFSSILATHRPSDFVVFRHGLADPFLCPFSFFQIYL